MKNLSHIWKVYNTINNETCEFIHKTPQFSGIFDPHDHICPNMA